MQRFERMAEGEAVRRLPPGITPATIAAMSPKAQAAYRAYYGLS